ncbi:PTS lactose/cellobiose transporter subunit IIA [Bacillus sonorensis]|uniref:Glucomannan-specific phosphotransferase system IIA component GmuA n=2 Tax=Bacillus sonorensis TaxID=119858 RepID=M5P5P7_9BACI|nr:MULTISPECIES: PTS lactose/cellobiose transporter subunit IIA [Bacillus]TWK76021.1 PTS system oligo-beta-mannoside-specific EIIA component [Bacillus paralicheniformis]ASB88545.1 Protein-N(pi)-phosphohistidine--sugar phosphotransferase [Bacillus sonorensis]EME74768.1 glucomannan-specific phosphotransferase system IIA component GmuA [Bacillus sonorensis L12]MCY8087866.1 PTS lactose/cellobiose transporter subunit IIA [Bacillus sonorensis]MCY8405030.1 PTS lactose/cellobiose transporter subunit I
MEKTKLNKLTDEQICFQLILHSGNARSKVIQSLREYRAGSVGKAEKLLVQAEEDLRQSHDIHFQMVQQEAGGKKQDVSLLLIHAEDHLMSSLTMKELVYELLEIFKDKIQDAPNRIEGR